MVHKRGFIILALILVSTYAIAFNDTTNKNEWCLISPNLKPGCLKFLHEEKNNSCEISIITINESSAVVSARVSGSISGESSAVVGSKGATTIGRGY